MFLFRDLFQKLSKWLFYLQKDSTGDISSESADSTAELFVLTAPGRETNKRKVIIQLESKLLQKWKKWVTQSLDVEGCIGINMTAIGNSGDGDPGGRGESSASEWVPEEGLF